MNEFSMKRGDTRPSVQARLLDETNEPRDLQNATAVRFYMKNVATQDVVVDNSAIIVNEDDGVVAYEWSDGDTETAGQHKAEFEVEYAESNTETFPNGDYINIFIEEDIA